jgi:hypothetical protein
MASAATKMADFTDDAGALISTAAHHRSQTTGNAEKLLADIDELIARRLTENAT